MGALRDLGAGWVYGPGSGYVSRRGLSSARDWGRSGVRANAWVRVQAGVRVQGGGVQTEDRVFDLVGMYAWVRVYARFMV